MSLKNKVAIAGADETDRIGIVPDMTPIMMHAEAARNALRDAGIGPREVQLWFPSRNGVLEMDLAEAEVMRALFGEDPPRAISVKDAVGEMAASGAGQVVAACCALADKDGPFSGGASPRRALVNSFGAGGNFLAAVLESAP